MAQRRALASLLDRRLSLRLFTWVLIYILGAYSVLFLAPERMQLVAGKEMLLENLGALWLLASSFLCLFAAQRMWKLEYWKRRGALQFLVLGLLFLVAMGEEISWGQQWFHFSTPEFIKEVNRQGEFNLHNLSAIDSRTANGERRGGVMFFLNSNRLFDYFMVGLVVSLPLSRKWWTDSPIRPDATPTTSLILSLLCLLALNYVMTFAWLVATDSPAIAFATSEIRESNNAFLCLAICAYWCVRAIREGASGTPSTSTLTASASRPRTTSCAGTGSSRARWAAQSIGIHELPQR